MYLCSHRQERRHSHTSFALLAQVLGYQLCGCVLPVVQSSLRYCSAKPFKRFLCYRVEMLFLRAAAIWLYPHNVGEVQRVIVTPFIGHPKIALLLGLQASDALTEQGFEFYCPPKRIILCPTFLQSIIHER